MNGTLPMLRSVRTTSTILLFVLKGKLVQLFKFGGGTVPPTGVGTPLEKIRVAKCAISPHPRPAARVQTCIVYQLSSSSLCKENQHIVDVINTK